MIANQVERVSVELRSPAGQSTGSIESEFC